MEFTISKGRGYVAEENINEAPIGTIAMDSIFIIKNVNL